MMKSVIIFIPTLITGGAEKFVTDLAINLDKKNFDITVAVTSSIIPEGYSRNNFFNTLLENNIRVIDLKGKNRLETAKNICKLFSEKRPDIIHTNYVLISSMINP